MNGNGLIVHLSNVDFKVSSFYYFSVSVLSVMPVVVVFDALVITKRVMESLTTRVDILKSAGAIDAPAASASTDW